ncbi:tyrosine-type recombinase/integrase [Mycobacterium sp. SMC-8]|uniref:tyrosine-type recombinase/integrase n=1 Tax=Mycobacterium sp. SMC-8 TaxID=2857060 RepID=UPI0021B2D25C|nr:tyrosine-type recombinase/integrase [Mycobacterium sp. SMC-8]
MAIQHQLRLHPGTDVAWVLSGPGCEKYALVNEYLGYLADRNYSPRTLRAYGYDLLAFCRWLDDVDVTLSAVTTETVLDFMRHCRQTPIAGRPANVVSMTGAAYDHYSSTTINHRLAALTGLYQFRELRDPRLRSPIPSGREARRVSAEERTGLLGHLVRPKRRSALRLREPRRLPRALNRHETAQLLSSLRTWRDRALAGLMLLSGLRSGELLTLNVTDVDIGARWVKVMGKGAKERRVPLDVEVAGLIQTYLLVERPESDSNLLFLVAKGPHRGQPLTAAGLRTIFRYHRAKTGVLAGHPHALRHTFGTAMAEAGVDLAVMQALLGHSHIDHHSPLHPSGTHPRQGGIRCCPNTITFPPLKHRRRSTLPTWFTYNAGTAATPLMPKPPDRFYGAGPESRPGPTSHCSSSWRRTVRRGRLSRS